MTRPRVLVGISGGTGSGKTTLAGRIRQSLGPMQVLVLDQDSYYLDAPEDGAPPDFDHPAALDLDLLATHVRDLRAGKAIHKPIYHFPTHSRRPGALVEGPRPVVVVEGIFALWHPPLRDQFDLRVFVECDDDVRLLRRIRRDVSERGRSLASVLDQYEGQVRRGHLHFVEPSKRWAHLVVRGDGEAVDPGFDRVCAEVEQIFLREPDGPRRKPGRKAREAVRGE